MFIVLICYGSFHGYCTWGIFPLFIRVSMKLVSPCFRDRLSIISCVCGEFCVCVFVIFVFVHIQYTLSCPVDIYEAVDGTRTASVV
jgi:hypothetical protein